MATYHLLEEPESADSGPRPRTSFKMELSSKVVLIIILISMATVIISTASIVISKKSPFKPGHNPSQNGCLCNKLYKDISNRPDVFESDRFPNYCCRPTIGNGYLATGIQSDAIFMNGVYNGKGTTSHRARIPSTVNIQISPKNVHIIGNSYKLDVSQGLFQRTIDTDTCIITHTWYAHQVYTRLLINEITIQRKNVGGATSSNITLDIKNDMGQKSVDIGFERDPVGEYGENVMHGNTLKAEADTTDTIPVYVHWSKLPANIILADGVQRHNWTFITSIAHTDQEAAQFYAMGVKDATGGTLHSVHAEAWKVKWNKGRIDVDNNLPLAKAIYGSMYYILSSLPPLGYTANYPFQFYGLSPGGLAHGEGNADYMGHVFWDQATWMYPPILMFHPELAKAMLSCRTMHIDAARAQAKQEGLKGTRFPWEMAYSGFDVTPAEGPRIYEIHVNGDIAFAVQQYISATWDQEFLANERGYELVTGLADYWASRSVLDEKKDVYVIKGVMPPDEYHETVDNSVYTNMIAKISLNLPKYAGQFINATVPSNWTDIADKMYILFDEEKQYHPEYEGYTLGEVIKQADVILLGFPLMVDMPEDVRKNDLVFYESYQGKDVTDKDGPAMTWGMFAIGWMELGNMTKANEMFEKSFENIQQPYKVWTETASASGAINFATGMGGLLQSVLFGYGGFRLRQDRLDFKFNLPPKVEHFNVTDVDYLGSAFDFQAQSQHVVVTLKSRSNQAPSLDLVIGGATKSLVVGKSITVPINSAASIQPHTAFNIRKPHTKERRS